MAEDYQSGQEQVEAVSQPDQAAQRRAFLRTFMATAHSRFRMAAEAETKVREEALADLKFMAGDQWPSNIQTTRDNDGRPCLTINRLPAMKRQITNEQRQQRPAVNVNPVGSGTDVETAEIFQGLIRHIEVNSDAEIAYDTGFEHAVISGFGYWEIITDYKDDDSFDQEIFIKRVKNPFAVYFDPSAIEPTYCDADWAFQIEDMPIVEYKRDYPGSDVATMADFQSIGDQFPEWATKDTIRVAKYWHVEYDKAMLYMLATGEVVSQLPPGATVLRQRIVQKRRVVCSKINAIEIIEEQDWPGMYIPIVPVLADDYDVDGKRHLAGIVRDARDPQRMYNYWVSSGTEMIALAPRAPFVGAVGQFKNMEATWTNANTKNYPYLEYEPITIGGQAVGPPSRQTFEPPVQAITLMTRQADSDLKAVVGIYDPTLGQNKSDQSGRAVALLQKQSDIGNLNWADNLSRAIRYTGKLLLDLIPKIYDVPQVQRIINPDGSVKHVGIWNSGQMPDVDPEVVLGPAVKKIYDLGSGDYDVTVSVGPSYQTKRQEAVASQLEVLKVLPPQYAQAILDMLISNMDWPQAHEMADRIKKLLPPQLQDDQDDTETQLARAQAVNNQLSQQNQLLSNALNQATEVVKTKSIEQQGKFAIEKLHADTQITIAEINTKAQSAVERAKMMQAVWAELHGSAHEFALQKDQQGHEQDLAKQQAESQPEESTDGGNTGS